MKKAVYALLWRLRRIRRLLPLFVGVCAIVLALGSAPHIAWAGFGITPPYVRSDRLTRNSDYTQIIQLVRSDPEDDLNVTITLNIPGAQSWFTIDKGNQFIIPKGVTQMPIAITVHVPGDANFQEYKGAIRIRTASANPPKTGGVSIALGAQVDVDLKVVDKIYDFDVHQVRVVDLEQGIEKWGLFFPGKIRFFMTVNNTGNTKFGPTRVHFDIYDSNGENKLESTDNTNNIEQIDPFATKEVLAELPTRLPAGTYVAKYSIYKNLDIAQQGEVNLSVGALGSVPGYEGYGFDGLSLADKLKVAAVFGIPSLIVILFILAIFTRSKRRRKRK